ncbi:MAG: sporulation integral membrane protein YtvI [Candidatus Carbobacillus altaicus]|uniref:Sporulation integral membrane protein YtvI n=1 Tax=Candidatus Carbonibacillus altaicus TaxID=2163959 RepID=A0A2R6Y3J4_9BACL|nr:sporulation integral membrane protein YtvI [Candidatus Carbobacillus altaicus]PTQ57222.1 MAG: hypothetical protein BSOLF_1987 [Candidatus Carbobacillus altaicus]
MFEYYKRYARTIFDIGLLIFTVYALLYVFSFLFQIARPIFYALFLYMLIHPFVRVLTRRRIGRALATTIVVIGLVLILTSILILLAVILTKELTYFAQTLPEYMKFLQDQANMQATVWQKRLAQIPPEYIQEFQKYTGQLIDQLTNVLKGFLRSLFDLTKGVPTAVTSWVVNWGLAVVLAFFLSIEYDRLTAFLREHSPRTFQRGFLFLKEHVLTGLIRYVNAQLKIVSITATIIFIGLLFLKVPNAFTIALLSFVADLLPVLGISTVFWPWIAYLFIVGDYSLGWWILGLYILVIVVRQIVEPRISGDSLGVSPFTMLSAIVISMSLFGVAGFIAAPIIVVLIKALYEQGYLKRWIHWPEE